MLIQIVSDIYGEVAEKKYLYVYRERVELICDLQAFSKIVSWGKRGFYYIVNWAHWHMTRIFTRNAHNSSIDSSERVRDMVNGC